MWCGAKKLGFKDFLGLHLKMWAWLLLKVKCPMNDFHNPQSQLLVATSGFSSIRVRISNSLQTILRWQHQRCVSRILLTFSAIIGCVQNQIFQIANDVSIIHHRRSWLVMNIDDDGQIDKMRESIRDKFHYIEHVHGKVINHYGEIAELMGWSKGIWKWLQQR